MPSSMTHTYFGLDVYNKINRSAAKKISNNVEYFKTFCQGGDVMYFYNLFCGSRAKYVYNIGKMIHTSNTQEFFIKLINYINEYKLKDNYMVMSFLYGYICHYFLDSVCHPFIFYMTGKFNSKDKSTYKYNALHADMEFYIDRYLIYKNEHIEPSKYKIYNNFLNINTFDEKLTTAMNYIFKIYNIDKVDKIYLKSIRDMKRFFRIFNYDYLGIKKKLYGMIDYITPEYITKVKELSYRGDYKKRQYYLNIEKNTWNNPCDKSLKYNYSFMELYDIALDKCVEAINLVDSMISNNNINQKMLTNIFKNLSYLTGLDCEDKLEMKYFYF